MRHRTLSREGLPPELSRSLVKPVTKATSPAGFPKVAVVQPKDVGKPWYAIGLVAISWP
jgi:hypothetical protein